MAKYLVSAVFVLMSVSAAQAQDAIYLCGTVYQNRPCAGNVNEPPVNLPALGRLTADLQKSRPAPETFSSGPAYPPPGYQRGRLGEPASEPEVSKRNPGADSNYAPRTRLLTLSRQAEYLRMNAPRLVRDFGPDKLMNRIDQTMGELDFLCKMPMVEDADIKDECRTAQRDLISAQGDVRSARTR